jgi:hypothetical protein
MPTRAFARRVTVTLGIAALLCGGGVGVAVAAPSDVAEANSTAAADEITLPAETGVTVPGSTNEAVGDVLGLGYEQVIRLNGSRLEIVAPAPRGGQVLESYEVGAKDAYPATHWQPGYAGKPAYYGLTMLQNVKGSGGASRLAVAGGAVYVSTILGGDYSDAKGSVLRKYVVEKVGGTNLLKEEKSRVLPDNEAITALDAYVHKNREYVAVGLNVGGVRILRADEAGPGMREVRAVHTDWTGRDGVRERDIVTAVGLGTDDQNRLILVAGKITFEHPAIVATDLRSGERERDTTVGPDKTDILHHTYLWQNNWREVDDLWWNGKYEWPGLIEIGRVGPNKKSVVAISWPTRNRTSFLYPENGLGWNWTDGTSPTTAVRYFTDADGENRVFVRRAPAGPILGMSATGGWEFYEDIPDGKVQYAVPGYRARSIMVENQSREAVAFRPYSGKTRAQGCWAGSELKLSADVLPKTTTTIAPNAAIGPFVTGQRTSKNGCLPEEAGALYFELVPSKAHERTQLIKLVEDQGGMRIDQQVGSGDLTVRFEQVGELGARLTITDQFDLPSPAAAPTLTATRLTPAPADDYDASDDVDDPTRPVYRFTVSNQKWQVPGADQLSNVTLPVPTVEASTDQENWTALGTTTSPLAPSRAGTEVTLGDSTFFWQTAPGATDYRYFRLTLPGGTVSETLDVKPLGAPADVAVVDDLTLIGSGTPRPNGLDQAPLRVSLLDKHSQALDSVAHAELYDRIYYRAPTGALVTGLGNPKRPSEYLAVGTSAGQFSNDAVAGLSTGFSPVYATTTSSRSAETFRAVFAPDGIGSVDGDAVPVLSAEGVIAPWSKALVADGIAGKAIAVAPCAEGACTLTEPTPNQPVLHGFDQSSISLQLAARTTHGALSLPLTTPEQLGSSRRLAMDNVAFSDSRASAWLHQPASFGYNATASGQLVTHGDFITFENLYVSERG